LPARQPGQKSILEKLERLFETAGFNKLFAPGDLVAIKCHFGEPGSRPVIFNTGQIIHGMVAGYIQLRRDECLEAALRASRWLAACQDEDGCWRRNVHNGVPHTYNTRAAWALLRTAIVAGDGGLREAATRNIEWALTQQTESGWFTTNAFTPEPPPFTHTIAYAIRGILESGLLLKEERYISAAARAARALATAQRADGWLAGTYADGWIPRANYCCLTGLAQMSIIWTRLARHLNDDMLFPLLTINKPVAGHSHEVNQQVTNGQQ